MPINIAMSKPELMVGQPPPSILHPVGATVASNSSPRSFSLFRTSSLLASAFNLRLKRRDAPSLEETDWARHVGGSEGQGVLYHSHMDRTERNQVMQSVITLAKSGEDDFQGSLAEPLPECNLLRLQLAGSQQPPSYDGQAFTAWQREGPTTTRCSPSTNATRYSLDLTSNPNARQAAVQRRHSVQNSSHRRLQTLSTRLAGTKSGSKPVSRHDKCRVSDPAVVDAANGGNRNCNRNCCSCCCCCCNCCDCNGVRCKNAQYSIVSNHPSETNFGNSDSGLITTSISTSNRVIANIPTTISLNHPDLDSSHRIFCKPCNHTAALSSPILTSPSSASPPSPLSNALSSVVPSPLPFLSNRSFPPSLSPSPSPSPSPSSSPSLWSLPISPSTVSAALSTSNQSVRPDILGHSTYSSSSSVSEPAPPKTRSSGLQACHSALPSKNVVVPLSPKHPKCSTNPSSAASSSITHHLTVHTTSIPSRSSSILLSPALETTNTHQDSLPSLQPSGSSSATAPFLTPQPFSPSCLPSRLLPESVITSIDQNHHQPNIIDSLTLHSSTVSPTIPCSDLLRSFPSSRPTLSHCSDRVPCLLSHAKSESDSTVASSTVGSSHSFDQVSLTNLQDQPPGPTSRSCCLAPTNPPSVSFHNMDRGITDLLSTPNGEPSSSMPSPNGSPRSKGRWSTGLSRLGFQTGSAFRKPSNDTVSASENSPQPSPTPMHASARVRLTPTPKRSSSIRAVRPGMKKWASASTDALALTGSIQSDPNGRDSMSIARQEASRPRKSLHLPSTTSQIDGRGQGATYNAASPEQRISSNYLTTPYPFCTGSPTSQSSVSLARPSDLPRRSSFNFLRKASENSPITTGLQIIHEPRSRKSSTASFAKELVKRTLGRSSSKAASPQENKTFPLDAFDPFGREEANFPRRSNEAFSATAERGGSGSTIYPTTPRKPTTSKNEAPPSPPFVTIGFDQKTTAEKATPAEAALHLDAGIFQPINWNGEKTLGQDRPQASSETGENATATHSASDAKQDQVVDQQPRSQPATHDQANGSTEAALSPKTVDSGSVNNGRFETLTMPSILSNLHIQSENGSSSLEMPAESLSNSVLSDTLTETIHPSLGIDQEQDVIDAAHTPPVTAPVTAPATSPLGFAQTDSPVLPKETAPLGFAQTDTQDLPKEVPSAAPTSSIDRDTADSGQSRPNSSARRASRTSRALFHLPRLDSMTANNTLRDGDQNSTPANDGNDHNESAQTNCEPHETSEEEQEESEEEDEDDTATDSHHGECEIDSDHESELAISADESFTSATETVDATRPSSMVTSSSSGGINRRPPAQSITLPPAPVFSSQSVPNGLYLESPGNGFKQVSGRESWAHFSGSSLTPMQTPRPGSSSLASFAARTPRARYPEVSETSYFTQRPSSSSKLASNFQSGTGSDIPPPSPSIISRSRAPSASVRTIGLPASPAIGSGPAAVSAAIGRTLRQSSLPPLAPLTARNSISSSSQKGGQGRDRIFPSVTTPSIITTPIPSTSGGLTSGAFAVSETATRRNASIERQSTNDTQSTPTLDRSNGTIIPKAEGRLSVEKKKLNMEKLLPIAPQDVNGPIRPGFYQQKSKSLIDLSRPADRLKEMEALHALVGSRAVEKLSTKPLEQKAQSQAAATVDGRVIPKTVVGTSNEGSTSCSTANATLTSTTLTAPALGRRRSMFEIRAEPPPYSIIHLRPEGPQVILPREEEGKEKLPDYWCGVHIEGYLPRKMEFSAPGLQAKDRSWKRCYFVLHGTSLRVYKYDLSVERYAANGAWGEMIGVHVHPEPMNEDGTGGGAGSTLGQAARDAISYTPFGHHSSHSQSSKTGFTEFDGKNGLIRNYSLQGAESGLAADYLKRRHIVRVRAEGEQFLVQTRSDRHVVDWIEALQAATNVSMDLEKRSMPKFITLPRRRRRRRRNPDDSTVPSVEQEARDLAEAQRRSLMDAHGRSASRSSNLTVGDPARNSMSRPRHASTSIENELNPSAAFEEMLREDHEGMGRHFAASDI